MSHHGKLKVQVFWRPTVRHQRELFLSLDGVGSPNILSFSIPVTDENFFLALACAEWIRGRPRLKLGFEGAVKSFENGWAPVDKLETWKHPSPLNEIGTAATSALLNWYFKKQPSPEETVLLAVRFHAANGGNERILRAEAHRLKKMFEELTKSDR